jgi:hypothetical protein
VLAWVLFVLTGAYGLGLSLSFLFFGRRIFEATDTTPPNHAAPPPRPCLRLRCATP